MTTDINELLKDAFYEMDVERVKALLKEGANPDAASKYSLDQSPTLLFDANHELAEILLSYGAYVNRTNSYRETPLHLAATHRKGAKLVKVLMRYGCSVQSKSIRGNTPLYLALHTRVDLEVVKLLLEGGSDVNHKSTETGWVCISLAMYKGIECIKLMIKIVIIRNFEKDVATILDLSRFSNTSNYLEMNKHVTNCRNEINEMKNEKIFDFTLYDVVTKKPHTLRPFDEKLITEKTLGKYPIYSDYISEKLIDYNDRKHYFKTLKNIHMVIICNEKRIEVNGDCLCCIGEYLNNEALLRLISVINYLPNDDLGCLQKTPSVHSIGVQLIEYSSFGIQTEESEEDIKGSLKRTAEEENDNEPLEINKPVKRIKLEPSD